MTVQKGSTFKRMGAAILDILVAFICFYFLQNLVVLPIIDQQTQYGEKIEQVRDLELDTYLFVYIDKDGKIVADGDTSEADLEKIVNNTDYTFAQLNLAIEDPKILDKYLTKFYTLIDKMVDFNKQKEDSGYFDKVDGSFVFKTTTSEKVQKQFYQDAYSKTFDYMNTYQDGIIIKLLNEINNLFLMASLISAAIPLCLFFIVLPMITKKRQTLGKKVFGLALIGKDGFLANRLQTFVRGLAFLILELFLSVFTMGIPLFISVATMTFSKKGLAIHDYLSVTIVVDAKAQDLFATKEEFLKAEELAKTIQLRDNQIFVETKEKAEKEPE